jgi:hypothetical protein
MTRKKPRGRPVGDIFLVSKKGRRTRYTDLNTALAACGEGEFVERVVCATAGNTYREELPKKARVLPCNGRGGAYRRGLRVRHRWLGERCLFCGRSREEVGAK